MYSMTGYGKGYAAEGGKSVCIEIKTVNHRYLDCNLKLPKNFIFIEDGIKKMISSSISRGHIDLFVTYAQESSDASKFKVDVALAKKYLSAVMTDLKEVADEYGLYDDDITLGYLAKVPNVVVECESEEEEERTREQIKSLAFSALAEALQQLKQMRLKEGEALKADVAAKLDKIEESLLGIKALAPKVAENYRNMLNARIAEAVSPDLVDAQRLATEVALYADHCCIDEEITRLSTHIASMRQMLNAAEPVGRKMEFLVQELNREANTIGSKANDLNITKGVLEIKNEIEKIREQAANIE